MHNHPTALMSTLRATWSPPRRAAPCRTRPSSRPQPAAAGPAHRPHPPGDRRRPAPRRRRRQPRVAAVVPVAGPVAGPRNTAPPRQRAALPRLSRRRGGSSSTGRRGERCGASDPADDRRPGRRQPDDGLQRVLPARPALGARCASGSSTPPRSSATSARTRPPAPWPADRRGRRRPADRVARATRSPTRSRPASSRRSPDELGPTGLALTLLSLGTRAATSSPPVTSRWTARSSTAATCAPAPRLADPARAAAGLRRPAGRHRHPERQHRRPRRRRAAAAQHVVDLGHRRIGIVALGFCRPLRRWSTGVVDDEHLVTRQRLLGWTRRAGRGRRHARASCASPHARRTTETGRDAGRLLLAQDPRPTAVLCFSDVHRQRRGAGGRGARACGCPTTCRSSASTTARSPRGCARRSPRCASRSPRRAAPRAPRCSPSLGRGRDAAPRRAGRAPGAAHRAGRAGEHRAAAGLTAAQRRPCTISSTPKTTKPRRGAVLDHPLGQVPAEQRADHDGQRVGGDHADASTEPGAEPALAGGERDRGEHRLVAELGEEERDADGEHGRRRWRATPWLPPRRRASRRAASTPRSRGTRRPATIVIALVGSERRRSRARCATDTSARSRSRR